jgi:hypothetical protein
MKYLYLTLTLLISTSIVTNSQENKPEILLGPANWEFERFPLPPAFAPQITYKGFEELRFAPGMFNKDSANYFTYAFVAQIDTLTKISENDVKNYLVYYFKGLCSSTAKDRKLTIDSTQISATVNKIKKTGSENWTRYDGTVNLFGVFADGAPVKLNMDISVANNQAGKKTYIFFLASPRVRNDAVWKQLYKIRDKGFEIVNR